VTVPIGLVLGGGSLLNQVARDLRTATEALLAPYDLTAQQAAALMLTSVRGRASPNQLTAELGTDTAGMTRLVDRLEAKGLVRRARHPDDRRSVVIELTADGRALLPKLPPVFGRVTSRLLEGFSADEITVLTGMLQRMQANLRAG
jgi:DNA-binding MarR family transcriptional regulator